MIGKDRLAEAVAQFVGRICTKHVAGGSGGSRVCLEFEPLVPRSEPLAHPPLSEEESSAYAIFILCAWRLDSEQEVLCGAWDDNSEGGPMLNGLDELIGKKLESYRLTKPGFDLELRFGDLSLRIFCDNVNEVDMADNYIVFLPGVTVAVAARSRIRQEDTDEAVG